MKPLLETGDAAPKPHNEKLNQQNVNRHKDKPDSSKVQQQLATNRPVPPPKAVPKHDAWEIPPIQCFEPEDGVFYAQMGPTGGASGYSAITGRFLLNNCPSRFNFHILNQSGHVGWGISWYINGLLIPEINVVRGKTYTFVVEGGNDPNVPAKYHPFYITNDPVGGYEHKSTSEREVN